MQLTPETLQVLVNFAAINENIVFRPGNDLYTIGNTKTVLGHAKLNQEFPRLVGIYDLPQFLSTLSMFDQPDIVFEDDYALIKKGRSRAKYYYSDVDMLTTIDKSISVTPMISFELSEKTLNSISSAAKVLRCNYLVFRNHEDGVEIEVSDLEMGQTANTYSTVVEAMYDPDAQFEITISFDNFRLAKGSYRVNIECNGPRLVSQFDLQSEQPLSYVIGLEKSSTYEVVGKEKTATQ